jgi:cytosine/uracil/thiamine/allantoin permease
VALVALAVGALPSLPGFLVQVKLVEAGQVGSFLVGLYHYAWFVGFGVALVAYWLGRMLTTVPRPTVALDQPQAALGD